MIIKTSVYPSLSLLLHWDQYDSSNSLIIGNQLSNGIMVFILFSYVVDELWQKNKI